MRPCGGIGPQMKRAVTASKEPSTVVFTPAVSASAPPPDRCGRSSRELGHDGLSRRSRRANGRKHKGGKGLKGTGKGTEPKGQRAYPKGRKGKGYEKGLRRSCLAHGKAGRILLMRLPSLSPANGNAGTEVGDAAQDHRALNRTTAGIQDGEYFSLPAHRPSDTRHFDVGSLWVGFPE